MCFFAKLYHDLLNQVADSETNRCNGCNSAGGQIALSFAQLLKEKHIVQPEHIVLISPVLDETMQHLKFLTTWKERPNGRCGWHVLS